MKTLSQLAKVGWFAILLIGSPVFTASAQQLIDGHIHYSHDAWDVVPAEQAVAILRAAGLKRAFVSSSSDEGTQRLYSLAPDLVVPVLRPYRKRGELGSWMHDDTVPDMLAERIARYSYQGIGEFHVDGADADLPVLRELVRLAKKHKLFLHAHSNADAVVRLFEQDENARILWAHAGFEPLEVVRETLKRYPALWADLSFRNPAGSDGRVSAEWRAVFEEFPDRFILGTDTYTPGRWAYVKEYAADARRWLKDLPQDLADNIAFKNAERLLASR